MQSCQRWRATFKKTKGTLVPDRSLFIHNNLQERILSLQRKSHSHSKEWIEHCIYSFLELFTCKTWCSLHVHISDLAHDGIIFLHNSHMQQHIQSICASTIYVPSTYSPIPNKQVGLNKQVEWSFSRNLIDMYAWIDV